MLNIALAYILQKAPYVFPIVGVRTVDHLTGNLGAIKVHLTTAEMDQIDQASSFEHGFPTDFLCGYLFAGSLAPADQASVMVTGPAGVNLVNGQGSYEFVEELKPIGRA